MQAESSLLKNTARLVTACLIVVIMVVGKSFLIPLAWSLFIAIASYPMLNKIEERTGLSRSLINAMFLLLLLAVLILIGFFFYAELSSIFRDMPTLSASISDKLQDLSGSLQRYGITVPDHVDKTYISIWVKEHNDLIMGFVSGIGTNIWNIILIMFYMFFLLYYRDLIVQFYLAKIQDTKRLEIAQERFFKSLDIIRSYLNGLLVITLISAVMNYAVFMIFGLKYALFFASFLAILNLIPFIGNPIGLVIIMLFAFLTKDGMLVPALIFVSLFVMNFLQDNVIRPWVMGDKMKINAFAVFIATIMGGMIWGVTGMILFIPLAGIVKVILESREHSGAYAIFFSELPKKPSKKEAIQKSESSE